MIIELVFGDAKLFCLIKTFDFLKFRDMTKIEIFLLRPPNKSKCHKVSFPKTKQNDANEFKT